MIIKNSPDDDKFGKAFMTRIFTICDQGTLLQPSGEIASVKLRSSFENAMERAYYAAEQQSA